MTRQQKQGSSSAARDAEEKTTSLKYPSTGLQNGLLLTGGVCWASGRERRAFIHLNEADGNYLGIRLSLLLNCGTLNSDYKETRGRAVVKMDTFFLEVSWLTFSIHRTLFMEQFAFSSITLGHLRSLLWFAMLCCVPSQNSSFFFF